MTHRPARKCIFRKENLTAMPFCYAAGVESTPLRYINKSDLFLCLLNKCNAQNIKLFLVYG